MLRRSGPLSPDTALHFASSRPSDAKLHTLKNVGFGVIRPPPLGQKKAYRTTTVWCERVRVRKNRRTVTNSLQAAAWKKYRRDESSNEPAPSIAYSSFRKAG
jgi:hypothetical protein